MNFIDTDDPSSIAAKRIRSSVIRSTPEPQLPIQGKQQPTTYIIEPDLMESQTGKMNLPNDVAFDDAGFAYNTVTGNPVQIVRRPNVLPIAKTPDGFTPVMPKVLDIVGNVMSPLAAGRVPVKAGEVVLGSGAVRTMPETVKEITPFYSALERTVDNAKIGKADANQWLGYLKNQPGVKSEELSWVLNNLPEGQISKDQLGKIVKDNGVKLGEKVLGDIGEQWQLSYKDGSGTFQRFDTKKEAEDAIKSIGAEDRLEVKPFKGKTPTKYHSYQLPGGERYQEMLLTLPIKPLTKLPEGFEVKPYQFQGKEHWGIYDANGQRYGSGSTKELALSRFQELYSPTLGQSYYKSSHWDEPNILAHVRYNDRNIPDVGKSLHLEEIQSDWHQAGRKQGYKQDLEAKAKDFENKSKELISKIDNPSTPNEEAARLMGEHTALIKEWQAHETALNRAVPDAPFKKNWDELAFKRMLHKAANEGYDSISWTPGEAQAARYDLSKQLKELQYLKNDDGTYQIAGITAKGDGFNHPENVTAAKLPDVVGKDMAEKIINNEGKRARGHPANGGYFEGVDLKIGGEGMKSFYDKMLVDKANALAKKYGAKVETKNISTQQGKILKRPDGSGFYISYPSGASKTFTTIEEAQSALNGQPIHVLKLTPELRAKAKEGFPLFSSTPITTPVDYDPFNNNKKYKLTPVTYDPFK